MARCTIYGITRDGVYADGGNGFTSGDLYEDHFAHYYYDYWGDIEDQDDGEIAKKLADLLSAGGHRPTVGRDENWWYIELDQATIDAYFSEMWRSFRAALKDVEKLTEEDMRSWYQPSLRNLHDVYSREGYDMINEMENGWLTPQDFMRSAKPGKKYYICGAVGARQ